MFSFSSDLHRHALETIRAVLGAARQWRGLADQADSHARIGIRAYESGRYGGGGAFDASVPFSSRKS